MKARFDWRAAYFNVVSLVAVIVFIVAAIEVGHGVLRLIFPTLSMNQNEWQQVQSYEAYRLWRGTPREAPRALPAAGGGTAAAAATVDEEQLRAEWNEYRLLTIEGERRRGLWDMLQALVTLIVALPVFWWHRRGAKSVKSEEEAVLES